MLLSSNKKWLYLILIFLLTSTLEAQRAKSLDEHFTDVEKSAKKVGYGLDSIKDFMDEVSKPDLFMPTTFFGLEPKWYKSQKGNFSTHYQEYGKSERKIRHITLKKINGNTKSIWSSVRFKMGSGNNSILYLNLEREKKILKKEISKNNIEEAMNMLFQNSKKINFLMEKYFYSKIRNLEKNVVFLDSAKPLPFDTAYFKTKYYPEIYISISSYRIRFKIKSYSKHEHYSLKNDFRSILDEYVKLGLCRKIIESDNIRYESLKNTGKYKSSITYTKYIQDGIWSIGGASDNAENDIKNISNRTEQAFQKLKEITKNYYNVVVDEIIKKYKDTEPRYNNQKFGSEF